MLTYCIVAATSIIMLCIILYKIKPKYIYYSFLFYKKKISQDKNFFSSCIQYVATIFLFTILYFFIEYVPISDFIGKIMPLLPDYVSAFLVSLKGKGASITIILALIELIILLFLFFIFMKTPTSPKNKIVNELSLDKIINYKNVHIFSFFGSIEDISNIQVIVTSENSDLELASFSSTSISGRVRNMASSKDDIGNVISDPLYENIVRFKKKHNKYNDFNLGTCIPSQPLTLQKHGVKCVIHAIAIKKNGDNTISYDDLAIKKIISYSIEKCIKNSFESIFIPIFGIGSAQQAPTYLINKQLESIKSVLDCELMNTPSTLSLNIYLGVYRELDCLFLKKTAVKTFR
ncbi:TPA: hypothetical protein MIM74_15710 [Klebsiella variicola]|nr:hypothetical protein [Klebsiella variicola]